MAAGQLIQDMMDRKAIVGRPPTIEQRLCALERRIGQLMNHLERLNVETEHAGKRKPGPMDVLMAVAEYFGVSISDVRAKGRQDIIVWPRHVAMSLCVELLGMRKCEVDRFFKRSNHITNHAMLHVKNEVETNRLKAVEVDMVRERVKECLKQETSK